MADSQGQGQAIDLRLVVTAMRRHRRLVIFGTVLGAVVGIGFATLTPLPYTSSSLVLIGSPGPDGAQLALDDASYATIATSPTVLTQAIEDQGSQMSVDELGSSVTVSSPSGSLVQIDVSDPDPAAATELSAGVALSFVEYIKRLGTPVTGQAEADLEAQIADLEQQADDVDQQLAAARARQETQDAETPEGVADAQVVAALTAERSDLAVRLTALQEQLRSVTSSTSLQLGVDARVLELGEPPVRPSAVVRALLASGLGALLGFAVMLVIALRRSVGDRTLHSPREVSRAVGAPVVAGLVARPQQTPEDWRALLGSYEPDPVDVWAVRLILRWLERGRSEAESPRERGVSGRRPPMSVVLIALTDDHRAASLGPVMAAAAASLGLRTTLTGLGEAPEANSLWAGLALARRHGVARDSLEVTRAPTDVADCDVKVLLTVVDPQSADFSDVPRADRYLLCLGSGVATVEDLSRIALAADLTDIAISGVVLANPTEWEDLLGWSDPSLAAGPRPLELLAPESPTRPAGPGTRSAS